MLRFRTRSFRMPARQRGVVAILVAILLPVLIGFAALAVDISYSVVIKNELQNTADATALAAAGCLVRRADCGNLNASVPDWSTAVTRGETFAGNNKVANLAVNKVHISYGYWNIKSANPSLTPLPHTPALGDVPAVMVTVNKKSGENGGQALTFFARIWDIGGVDMSATAVAAITEPSGAKLFPLAIAKCLIDKYWDTSKNAPRLATSTSETGNDFPQTVGQPIIFGVTSEYKIDPGLPLPCETGQWSSLTEEAKTNATTTIRTLIATGSTNPVSIGNDVWVQPGFRDTLYSTTDACSSVGTHQCEYAIVPVVSAVDTGNTSPVVGIACLRILYRVDVPKSSKVYLASQLSADGDKCQVIDGISGVGPSYGVFLPSRLVF